MKIKKLLYIAYFEYYTLNKINFKNIIIWFLNLYLKILIKKIKYFNLFYIFIYEYF